MEILVKIISNKKGRLFRGDDFLSGLSPNFKADITPDGIKNVTPIKETKERIDAKHVAQKKVKPEYQKNTESYMDSDYGSIRKKAKSAEIRGSLSHIYTSALMEVLKKKSIKVSKRLANKTTSPADILRMSAGPSQLKMVIRIATAESISIDPESIIKGIKEDVAGGDECIVSIQSFLDNENIEMIIREAEKCGAKAVKGINSTMEAINGCMECS